MKPSDNYDRVVDVIKELLRFTWLLRDRVDYLVDPYSGLKSTLVLPACKPVSCRLLPHAAKGDELFQLLPAC